MIYNYPTERAAQAAIKRLLKRYPVRPDCTVTAVASQHWQYPFRWLIAVTGRDGRVAYWTKTKGRTE
jgi:hypothetical protein